MTALTVLSTSCGCHRCRSNGCEWACGHGGYGVARIGRSGGGRAQWMVRSIGGHHLQWTGRMGVDLNHVAEGRRAATLLVNSAMHCSWWFWCCGTAMREGAEMVKVAEEGMPESRSVWIGLGHICGTRLLVAWLCSLSLYSVTRWAPMGKVADPLLTCFISDSRPAIPIGGILHPDSQPLSTKLELTHTHIQLSIYDIWSSLNLTYSGPCCVLMWDCGGLVPPWLLKVSNPYHIPGLTLLCEARMKP
jgi:hypothetical protein